MSPSAITLCAAALLLAACGADTEPVGEVAARTSSPPRVVSSEALEIIAPADADGSFPGDLWVGCRSGPRFQISDLEQIVPLAEGDPGGVSQAIQFFLGGGEGQYWPQMNWLILRETEDEVLLVHQDSEGLAFMNANWVGGAWRWSGAQSGGPCPLYYVVPAGLHQVDWRLDPSVPPDASARRLEVLITERECVSGLHVGSRLRGPQIVMTEDVVRVAFAAVPPAGDAFTCPSNPETPLTVELPAPLGEREIIEGLAIGIALEDYLPAADTR